MLRILLVSLVLTGCAVDPKVNFITRLAMVCDSYAASLNILSIKRMKGDLSPGSIRTVEGIRRLVNPVCTDPSISNPQEAYFKILQHVETLVVMR